MPYWEDGDWERWDSVAEHSYRMAMLAVILSPYLRKKLDLLKTLKMILIHDIVEVVAKDASPIQKHQKRGGHGFDKKAFKDKYERESNSSKSIFKSLPRKMRDEFLSLFKEYNDTKANPLRATYEGKFAYALDKIEAIIQVIDWRKPRKNLNKDYFEKSMDYLFEWTSYDPVLKELSELLRKECLNILR